VAVHHFTAPDLVTKPDPWQPMSTFPTDGTIVEVIDANGVTAKAQWHSERVLTASLSVREPVQWRPLE
jgi:hypothetical protein